MLKRIAVTLLFVFGLVLVTPQINFAKSRCNKIKKKSSCVRKPNCTWVKSHKKKKGKKRVKGYCRKGKSTMKKTEKSKKKKIIKKRRKRKLRK